MATKKLLLGIAAVSLLAIGVGCAGSRTVPMESVALVLSGSAHDGGWNESAARGLGELQAEGAATSLVQDVPQENNVAALENYARAGFTYVIAHGGEFSDAVMEVSARYPNVRFIQTNGDGSTPNWRSLRFNDKEVGYVMGYMAALMSPTGKVGLILQKDEPATVAPAVLHGAQDAVPGATLTVATTEDYDTPAFGEAAAEELVAAGVDSIAVLVDGAYPGVHTALIDAPGVKTIRFRAIPEIPAGQPEVMGGVLLHAGGVFKSAISAYKQGLPSTIVTLGFKEDALELADFAAGFSETKRQQVQAAVQGIVNGTIVP